MQNLVTTEASFQPYNREEWKQGYQSQPNEYDYWIDEIEGEIPKDLNGTLFRNGPGLLEVGGVPVRHPFDGDGAISAFSFKDGRAHYRNRFVRTEGYVKEKEAGNFVYRGVFGTQKPGGWIDNAFDFRLKNIANTNVIYWGDRLLALWEAAEPHSLKPENLETIGLEYLDGVLEPGDAFAAHPWIDPSCELDDGAPCLVTFGIKTGFSSNITIYEFNPAGKLLRRHSHVIPGFAFIHDFAITPNYCIFFQNPVSFNPLPFLLGFKGAGECVNFQPGKKTRIVLIPRKPPFDKNNVKIFETRSGFIFHHANAFESGDKVCVDSVTYQNLPQIEANISFKDVDFDVLAPGQLWRFSVDLPTGSVDSKLIESRCCEFPYVHPNKAGREHRYIFLGAAHNPTGNAPLQAILKLDVQSGDRSLHSFAPKGYVSEPIFVPKPNATSEDEGWVLTLVYDASHHRSDLVILDGQNLQGDAIATLHLKHHVPYGLHGNWTNECFV